MSRQPVWLIFRCAADAPSVSILDGRGFSLPAAVLWSLAAGCDFCGRRGRDVNRMASVVGRPYRICDHCTALAVEILQEQGVQVRFQARSADVESLDVIEIERALEGLQELGLHADVISVLVARVSAVLDGTTGHEGSPRDAPDGCASCSFCLAPERTNLVSGPTLSICAACVRRVSLPLWNDDVRRTRADLRCPMLRPAQPGSELRIQVRRLAREPADPRAWYRVGWLFSEKADNTRAAAAFASAAVLFSAAGDLLKASATWAKVLEVDPGWSEAAVARARIEEELGLDHRSALPRARPDAPAGSRERIRAAFAPGADHEGALDVLDAATFRRALSSHLSRALEVPEGPAAGRLLLHLCPGRVASTRSETLWQQVRELNVEQIDAVVTFLELMLAEPRAQEHAREVTFGLETFWRPLARLAR